MADLVYSDYTIKSSDKDALKALNDQLEVWLNTEFIKNSWDGQWLGNIVKNSGMYPPETIDAENDKYPVFCNGKVWGHNIDQNGDLEISIESKWSACDGIILDLAKKFLDDHKIDFTTEYSASGDYITNCRNGFIVEYCGCNDQICALMEKHFGDEELANDGVTEEKLEAFLREVYEMADYEDLEDMDLADMIEDIDEIDEDLLIHEWEYGDLDEDESYFAEEAEKDR